MSLVVDDLLPEVIHEQEEPDSAFEATQYFFEDITPDTSMGETEFFSESSFSTPFPLCY